MINPNPYLILMTISVIISVTLGLLVLRYRNVPGALPLSLLIFAFSEWAFCYSFEVFNPHFSLKIFWLKMEYPGITFSPVFWFYFACHFTHNKRWITPIKLIGLSIIPTITTLLAFTNSSHLLIWESISSKHVNGLYLLNLEYGSWFLIHVIYSYILFFIGGAIILYSIFKFQSLFRQQAALIITSILISVIANVAYVLRISPIPDFDYTPFTAILSAAIITYAIFRYHLFNIVPLAQGLVIKNMKDGVIFIDNNNRIVDCNPSAREIFDLRHRSTIGGDADKVLPHWLSMSEENLVYGQEIIHGNGTRRFYDIETSFLKSKNGTVKGKLLILHDITEQKIAKDSLVESEARFRTLYENFAGGFLLIGEDFVINDVNSQTCIITGFSRDELIGQSCDIICPSKSLHEECPAWKDDKNGIQSLETTIKTKSGLTIPILKNSKIITIKGKKLIIENFQDISQQKKAEAQIKKDLQEKHVLIQEIHHRVRNNMQIMVSLLQLQSNTFEDKKTKEILQIASNRIFSMAAVHDDLYTNDSLSEIDFHLYLQKLIPRIVSSFKNRNDVDVHSDATGLTLDIDQAISVGIIINEILTHIMKIHLQEKSKGHISIAMKREQETFVLRITDSSIAFPQMNTLDKSDSFGRELISMLGERQLGGEIHIHKDNGSSFILSFPESKESE